MRRRGDLFLGLQELQEEAGHYDPTIGYVSDVEDVVDAIQERAWEWFHRHRDDVLISILWVVKVRVRDLRGLFVRLFGDEPDPTGGPE